MEYAYSIPYPRPPVAWNITIRDRSSPISDTRMFTCFWMLMSIGASVISLCPSAMHAAVIVL
jgi:hypothetical protein